jgi:DNA-directed RNA polymerase subunit RPC12/RpoP
MTSPVVDFEIKCPNCEEKFTTWHRTSVNLSIGEKWTNEQLYELMFVNCPGCSSRLEKDVLVMRINSE